MRFLYFACARAAQVGGMCRLGGGGLAGRKCARRAARGAPGVLCARSTSRMVVGKAPVAARGALRALKPRAAPWRRGEGSVARACCCRVSWQVRGQIVVGHVKFCQCPASATKIHPSIARHGMGRPPYPFIFNACQSRNCCQWDAIHGHLLLNERVDVLYTIDMYTLTESWHRQLHNEPKMTLCR